MKKKLRFFLVVLLAIIIVYVIACVLGSIWLGHVVMECNTSTESDKSVSKYFSDHSLMNELDYRSEALHLTMNPTFDIQVSMPYFVIGFGHAKARFYVTWNGYEQLQGQMIHRRGVSKQPVDVYLHWRNGQWVITSINKHEFID